MLTVICVLLCLVIVAVVAVKLYLAVVGTEDVRVDVSADWEKVSQDEQRLVIRKPIVFSNEGKQCATIMDAFVRSQLPYEQYDGLEVRGKAELEGAKREDDYFEAVLIQKKGDSPDKLTVWAEVSLTARRGSLADAIAHVVDVPVDFVWQETGRAPQHLNKLRLVATDVEVAKLAGVELAKD